MVSFVQKIQLSDSDVFVFHFLQAVFYRIVIYSSLFTLNIALKIIFYCAYYIPWIDIYMNCFSNNTLFGSNHRFLIILITLSYFLVLYLFSLSDIIRYSKYSYKSLFYVITILLLDSAIFINIMMCYCASLHNFMLVTWDQLWWGCLYKWNQKKKKNIIRGWFTIFWLYGLKVMKKMLIIHINLRVYIFCSH